MLVGRPSLIGRRVDRYDVIALLGEGGFGAVYRARHMLIGTELALKVLWPEQAKDARSVERFLREARAVALIGSPHIVRVRDAGTTEDGFVFLAMELLAGRDLGQELEQRQRLPVTEACTILEQVLHGLSAAHAAGILHRDLKPANIFLAGEGSVKLLDFGVSKIAGTTSLTGSGMVVGTPMYMAPEQLAGKRNLDPRADLYSAGVILYETLSGRLPFEGVGIEALVRRAKGAPPVALRSVAPEVPEGVAEVVHRALAANPDGRWQSADVMAGALRAALENRPLPSLPPVVRNDARPASHDPAAYAPTDSAVPAAPHKSRSGLWLVLGGLACFVLFSVCGVGIGLVLFRDRDRPPPERPSARPSARPMEFSLMPWSATGGVIPDVVERARPQIEECRPTAGGMVRVRITVLLGLGSSVATPSSPDDPVAQCVADAIRRAVQREDTTTISNGTVEVRFPVAPSQL